MKKVTLFIGLNDKETHVQKISKIKAMKLVQWWVSNAFWGWTISEALGVFKHEDWTIVLENSIRVETMDFWYWDKNTLDNFVDLVKRELNQESVLVETEEKDVVFA